MQGSFLRFYVHENHRYQRAAGVGVAARASQPLGVRGGSAFRAMAGFGRHHVLHESHFFELAGTLTVEVEFMVTDDGGAAAAGAAARSTRMRLFYALIARDLRRRQPDCAGPGAGEAAQPAWQLLARSRVCSGTVGDGAAAPAGPARARRVAPLRAATARQRAASSWYSRVPVAFQASSSGLSSRTTRAGTPMTSVRGGTTKPARTKLAAPTKASSPTTTPSMTTARMPISAPRRTLQPCSTAP